MYDRGQQVAGSTDRWIDTGDCRTASNTTAPSSTRSYPPLYGRFASSGPQAGATAWAMILLVLAQLVAGYEALNMNRGT